MGGDDEVQPPQEDTRSVLDRLETRARPGLRRTKTAGQPRRRHPLASGRTIVSDPDDNGTVFTRTIWEEPAEQNVETQEAPQQTDADGDDEDDRVSSGSESQSAAPQYNARPTPENMKPLPNVDESSDEDNDDFFRTPMTVLPRTAVRRPLSPSESSMPSYQISPTKMQKPAHSRNLSTSTVLFSPTKDEMSVPSSPLRRPKTSTRSGTATPGWKEGSTQSGTRTPKRQPGPLAGASRPRAILPLRDNRQVPNIANFLAINHRQREPSFNAVALDLASDLGDNNLNPNFGNLNTLPASFTTQFELAARMKARDTKNSDTESDSNRMSRIMLARMTTLEEGFRDMLKEVKGLKTDSQTGTSRGTHTPPNELAKKKLKGKKKSLRRDAEERMGSSL